MDQREKILSFIRIHGPVLPVQIAKEINSNILFASAHLAELSSHNKLKISHIKVGGSPLYYLPGQELGLEQYADNLHEKEKEAFDILAQKKVLRDKEVEPAIRVALREIRDFAVPLEVDHKENKEIFWRWHMISTEEAQRLIKEVLQPPVIESPKSETKVEEKKIEPAIETLKEEKQELKKSVEERPKEKSKKEIDIKKYKEEEKRIREERKLLDQERKRIEEEKKHLEKEKQQLEKQMQLVQGLPQITDPFLDQLKNFFLDKKIAIMDFVVLKKNSEIDLTLNVPSTLGDMLYYCKAVNKKKISETDITQAFLQGQAKKLPVLLLGTGIVTKKAQAMLEKDFKGVGFKKI